ncbi:hypothetical protein TERTU_2700 [Teredinibacter turnerae T7901]|uniref:Uncharacterized protein n=1 Tax=Teredinibacter turnerae (strain ATCC 39867 / T7901) TaxID=377629 RepID=C5BM17_TERTT|nr:hypothetical protein TERTU_2700 [Teredinibacter turnerae T7901]
MKILKPQQALSYTYRDKRTEKRSKFVLTKNDEPSRDVHYIPKRAIAPLSKDWEKSN